MRGDVKVHHYLPRFYLEGFTASPRSRLLYAYQKGSERVIQTTPDRVGYEKHYYSFTREDGTRDSSTIESYLAEEIEKPGNRVIRKIRSHQPLDETDKAALSDYLAVMLKRVPRHRAKILEIFPEVRTQLEEQLGREFRDAAIATPERAEMIEQRWQEAQTILNEYETSIPDGVVVQQINTSLAPRLRAMTWQFLTTIGGHGFLTCDSPVYFHEGPGLAHPQAEVTFPIATNITLWATWRTDLQEGYVLTTPQAVDQINQRTASIASRWLFHRHDRRWIRTLAKKSSYRIMRLT